MRESRLWKKRIRHWFTGILSCPILSVCVSFHATAENRSPITSTIIGGSYEDYRNWSVAYLENGRSICSGAVIGKKTILTAAHCIQGWGRSRPQAYIRGKRYRVEKVYRGPLDVGMLSTSNRINARSFDIVRTDEMSPGTPITVLGFGAPDSGYLKITTMVYGGLVSEGVFRGFSIDGSTACPGDSGGPALVPTARGLGVLGIVSQGPGCEYFNTTDFTMPGSSGAFRWVGRTYRLTER